MNRPARLHSMPEASVLTVRATKTSRPIPNASSWLSSGEVETIFNRSDSMLRDWERKTTTSAG